MSGNPSDGDLETFITGFSSQSSGCRRLCACGKEFFDGTGEGWDWEDGELERLRDSGATELPYSVHSIVIHGREYVADCICWKERGRQVKAWLDNNALGVARYLSEEKKRKEREAAASPVVEGGGV